jgi:uncharacterized protein
MGESVTINFNQAIPLFPLAGCALLPHATVPLHIFEPRYREMVRETLDDNGLIAMATFEGDDWKADYEGNPPIKDHVCVGYIVRHERLFDGRYTILLQGVCRARVRKEIPHEPYRVALLEPTETATPMEIDLDEHRQRIEGLLNDPMLGQLASVSAIRNWMGGEVPTVALIDLSILALANNPGDRYKMLRETDPEQRADWLEHFLAQTRRTIQTATRFGTGKSDEGWHLN